MEKYRVTREGSGGGHLPPKMRCNHTHVRLGLIVPKHGTATAGRSTDAYLHGIATVGRSTDTYLHGIATVVKSTDPPCPTYLHGHMLHVLAII